MTTFRRRSFSIGSLTATINEEGDLHVTDGDNRPLSLVRMSKARQLHALFLRALSKIQHPEIQVHEEEQQGT